MHIFKPWKKDVQSCIKIGMKLYKSWVYEVPTVHTLSIHFHKIWGQKMTKFTKWEKWQKLIQGLYPNHMHISRPWRHVQSFKKIGIKLCEELRSSIHFHRICGQKMTKFTKWKKWQKLKQRLYPNHMHIFRPWRKHAKFQKDRYKIVWGVALTRYPLPIHWGRKMTRFTKWKNWQKTI